MAVALFEKGREGFLDGSIDWDAAQAKRVALLDLTVADAGVKAITGATNATPIVVTATSHGFATGDLVLVGGVLGNLAANGVFKIANVATNTFELTHPVTGTNVTGSGAYTSGGYAVNLSAADNLDDLDACRYVGTTDQAVANRTKTNGIADGDDVTFANVADNGGRKVHAYAIYDDTGTASTSRLILINDGRQIVTCAKQAASSATSIDVEKLLAGIPNGTVLVFSNGQTATLSAAASAGDRTLTVSALGGIVAAEARADAPMTGSNLPINPNGGNLVVQFDNDATRRIFKL